MDVPEIGQNFILKELCKLNLCKISSESIGLIDFETFTNFILLVLQWVHSFH